MEQTSDTTVLNDIKSVLTNFRVLLSCFFAGLMVGPLEGFADVWGTAYLKQVYGLDGVFAASLPSMIFIGMCFGAPILSYIADKSGSYLVTIIGSGIIMVGAFAFMMLSKLSTEALSLSFVMMGICCAYQILAIYKASTYVSENVAGLTTAVANMIIMIFGYIFHATMGSVINGMGGPSESLALIYGVSVIPVALCVGILGFMVLLSMEKSQKAFAAQTVDRFTERSEMG